MRLRKLHNWNLAPVKAVALQNSLRPRLIDAPPADFEPRLVAGADVSANRFSDRVFAAVVVVRLPDMEIVETATASGRAAFPYIPGLLAFREIPALMEAFRAIRSRPDAVLFDGQGIAHPRGMGLAAHAGLLLDCPTVGCAKSLYVGEPAGVPAHMGDSVPLMLGENIVGAIVRTREGVKPLYVSPGHRMDVVTAALLTLACCAGRRLPEPTRLAHIAANNLRREQTGVF